jgi:2-methylcitrate dehydratase PrpD
MSTPATPAPVTRQLGAFVASVRSRNVPAEAFETAKLGFTDCVATMLAGSVEDAPKILREALEAPRGSSSLFLTRDSAPALEAALINGTAAHALDYDDVALRGHPSTVIVPAILAEAEALGSSGRDMVLAFIAGYEVWAELAWRDPDNHHFKGWHPTGIFGAVGAAAACALLHGLDAEKSAHALALGASGSAGLMANFGTMSKPFHAGQSARAGVLAARLAKAGFTGALDAIEHPQGFLAAVSPGGKVDRVSAATAGDQWRIVESGLNIKKYPLCYCTHRALDCMLDLVKEHPIRADDVADIHVLTSRRNATILRNARPQTGLEAKFSMEFAMASAIVAGSAGLKELTDGFVLRPEVQALFPKVRMELDDRAHPTMPGHSPYDVVTVTLKDGRRIASKQVSEARGAKLAPLYEGELEAKFRDCFAIARPSADHAALFGALQRLETVRSVGALVEAAA